MSPRKVRLVTNLIKGMGVRSAKAQLLFLPKKAAGFLLKLLNSAIANAKHNFNLKEDGLSVLNVTVDGGPTLKRWMPRAMGKAAQIMKRTSHITLILTDGVENNLVSGKANLNKKNENKEAKDMQAEQAETAGATATEQKDDDRMKSPAVLPAKPGGASSDSKKRYFSRQSLLNLKKDAKKIFRRKSI